MNAENILREYWGKSGEQVIDTCKACTTTPMTFDEFLSDCTACGGNWGGMLLTGIKALYPAVWDAIPDDMGHFAWSCLTATLELLDVTFPKDEE